MRYFIEPQIKVFRDKNKNEMSLQSKRFFVF